MLSPAKVISEPCWVLAPANIMILWYLTVGRQTLARAVFETAACLNAELLNEWPPGPFFPHFISVHQLSSGNKENKFLPCAQFLQSSTHRLFDHSALAMGMWWQLVNYDCSFAADVLEASDCGLTRCKAFPLSGFACLGFAGKGKVTIVDVSVSIPSFTESSCFSRLAQRTCSKEGVRFSFPYKTVCAME